MRAREFVFEDTAEGLTEIENMPANNFVGGKHMLDTRKRPAKRNLQPLPGSTDLLYAVDQDRHGERVVIVEPGVSTGTKPRVVAALYLATVDYLPNTVQVISITVNEDYRGRGLAKALYDIVLTKMRKNLLSGDAQTPGGKRNWMSLASIPGVEVKGMVRIPNDIFDMHKTHKPSLPVQKYYDRTMDQIMELGGQFFYDNKTNGLSYWLFDVVPGKGQLEPYVKNSLSKLYGYDAGNLLLATWNRGINESQQDFTVEMAGVVNVGISQALAKKGYQYLGGGIDKQAYLEPGTGQVLIVFGYRKGVKDFSPDQRMFIDWISYCNKNKNNPHLPKFSGFESFQFQGKNYIQARMEPLQELPDDVGMLVAQIDDVVKNAKQNFKRQIKNISSYATFASADQGDSMHYELEDTIKYLGGEQAAMNLLKTVYGVKQFGRQHGFSIDLHRGNYMARADGTIVVNDPFVLWLRSE